LCDRKHGDQYTQNLTLALVERDFTRLARFFLKL